MMSYSCWGNINLESANSRLNLLNKYSDSIVLNSLLTGISVHTVSMATVSFFDSNQVLLNTIYELFIF